MQNEGKATQALQSTVHGRYNRGQNSPLETEGPTSEGLTDSPRLPPARSPRHSGSSTEMCSGQPDTSTSRALPAPGRHCECSPGFHSQPPSQHTHVNTPSGWLVTSCGQCNVTWRRWPDVRSNLVTQTPSWESPANLFHARWWRRRILCVPWSVTFQTQRLPA